MGGHPTPDAAAATVTAEPVFDDRYLDWKNWHGAGFAVFTTSEAAHYSAELRRTGLSLAAGTPVLDIGFGYGPFLGFGRSCGWHMVGAEANPALVAVAQQHGFEACLASELSRHQEGSFQLITAFDVLEHVPQEHLAAFLAEIRRLLRPGGCFVARYPNGDSPFGLINQHGDITHVTVLGSGKIRYFTTLVDLELRYLGAEAQPFRGATRLQVLHRLFAVPAKAILNWLINLIFFPRMKVAFCATNAVAVWRKPLA